VIKQVPAVLGAYSRVKVGFFSILLVIALWSPAMILGYGGPASIVVAASLFVGIGLRLHLSSYRAHLIPGFRETNHIIALGFALASVLVTSIVSAAGIPTPLSIGALWLCALVCLYLCCVFTNPLQLLPLLFFIEPVTRLSRGYVSYGMSAWFSIAVGVLFAADILLTILVWKRVSSMRGSAPSEARGASWHRVIESFGNLRPGPASPDSLSATMPQSWAGHIYRLFRSMQQARALWVLGTALVVPLLPVLTRHTGPPRTLWLPTLMPVFAGLPPTVSARMFMLPLDRKTIVKRWAGAILLCVLMYWAACVLPFCVSLLLNHAADPMSILKLATTALSLQLPLFGIALAALSIKTPLSPKPGVVVRLNLMVGAFLVVFDVAEEFIRTHETQTILGSILLGPILIWLAYRRWCIVEVS